MVPFAKHIAIILIFLTLAFNSFSQEENRLKKKVLKKEDYIEKKDSLKAIYGHNKKFLDKIELQALVALTYYPELKDCRIIFRRKRLKTTMAARPTFWSLIKRRSKRTYVIHLNDFDDVDVPFDSTSFNAQIGIIGHELAHILDYEHMTKMELVWLGFKYRDRHFRARMEVMTDVRTIYRGLGWQVWAFEHFVSTYPQTPREYKKYKAQIYLSPEDILGYIKEYESILEKKNGDNETEKKKLSSK